MKTAATAIIVASYNVSIGQYAKPVGRILILDFVITNTFIHSLPGMILLYSAMPLFIPKVFCIRYLTLVRFMHTVAIGSELLTQKLHQDER